MEKIYSEVRPGELLHVVHFRSDFTKERFDFSPEKEFIQATSLYSKTGRVVSAHKHLLQKKTTTITQEAIVVISGCLNVKYYDLDHKLIKKITLNEGDCTLTFRGGHEFEISPETRIYEFKTGPYFGKEKDKEDL